MEELIELLLAGTGRTLGVGVVLGVALARGYRPLLRAGRLGAQAVRRRTERLLNPAVPPVTVDPETSDVPVTGRRRPGRPMRVRPDTIATAERGQIDLPEAGPAA